MQLQGAAERDIALEYFYACSRGGEKRGFA